MAVDLVGLNTVEHFNRLFQNNHHGENFTSSSSFQQAVSALKRSGHARFRRAPVVVSDPHAPSVSSTRFEEKDEKSVTDKTMSFHSSSLITSSFGEGSVSKCSSLGIVAPAPSFSAKKPPLPSSHRKRNGTDSPSVSVSHPSCHCCKRRKTDHKRRVKKIPIIGSKVDSIPADDYTWKKYGQKKVDRSSFPRVYYKCNSAKGCPARKRIEVVADSKMLIVTYDREHKHHHTPTPLPTKVLQSLQI